MHRAAIFSSISCIAILGGCGQDSADKVPETDTPEMVHPDVSSSRGDDATPVYGTARITTGAKLSVGDTFVYRYAKLRAQSEPATEPQHTVPLEIKIIDANESGYMLSWQLMMPEFSDNDTSYQAELSRIGRTPNIVWASKDFDQFSLKNKDELYDLGLQTAELMIEHQGFDPESAKGLRQMFADRAFSESMYIKPISIFFLCMGWEAMPGEEFVQQTELVSEWGDPLPMTLRVTLDRDPRTGDVTWLYRTGFEGEQVASALDSYMQNLSGLLQVPLDEIDASQLSMDMNDSAKAEFSYMSPMPRSMEVTRIIQATDMDGQDTTRVDQWFWSLVREQRSDL